MSYRLNVELFESHGLFVFEKTVVSGITQVWYPTVPFGTANDVGAGVGGSSRLALERSEDSRQKVGAGNCSKTAP